MQRIGKAGVRDAGDSRAQGDSAHRAANRNREGQCLAATQNLHDLAPFGHGDGGWPLALGQDQQIGERLIQASAQGAQQHNLLCALAQCMVDGQLQIGLVLGWRMALDLHPLACEVSDGLGGQRIQIAHHRSGQTAQGQAVECAAVRSHQVVIGLHPMGKGGVVVHFAVHKDNRPASLHRSTRAAKIPTMTTARANSKTDESNVPTM